MKHLHAPSLHWCQVPMCAWQMHIDTSGSYCSLPAVEQHSQMHSELTEKHPIIFQGPEVGIWLPFVPRQQLQPSLQAFNTAKAHVCFTAHASITSFLLLALAEVHL